MRNVAVSISMLSCLVFGGLSRGRMSEAAEEAKQAPIRVVVDPRVELMSVIFRLAGNREYNQGRVESYTKDVETQFGPFRQHRAVEMARNLRRQHGVSYDACMSMAVHLTDPLDLQERVPFAPRPEALDARWPPDEAREFLQAAKQFVREASFKEFIDKHRTLYDVAQSRMEATLKDGHIDWFDRFFGARPAAQLTVVLGMLNGGQCYGPHFRSGDGKEELYCILGVWQTDSEGKPEFTPNMLKTVVHEFCHSYTNPVIDRHESELKAAGEKLFARVESAMQRQAYGNWKTMLYESLVRASTLRYVRQYDGPAAATAAAKQERMRGFAWVGELSALLGEYEAQRDRYPNLESFAPRLVAFFSEQASKQVAAAAKAPKVVSMSPANGQQDVDPGVTKIQVVFDRPMQDRAWSMIGGGPNFPEVAGRPSYDAKRTTWSVPVKLKPEWKYRFMLNSDRYQAFQSEDGTPLEPVEVTFTTGK